MSIYSRRSRREFLRDSGIAGGALAFGGPLLAACGTSSTSSGGGIASSGKPTRANTLYVGGFQWGPPTNFNPVGPNSSWPTGQGSGMMHIYEALFGFDVLAGDIKGILAKNITYPDQSTMVITLYSEAHWQDGKPLTADDVVYTLQLSKKHSDLNYSQFWQYVSDVSKKDDHTVQISLNKSNLNPGQVRHFLATIWILPQHIWTGVESKGGSLLQYTDTKPVGSGPYKVYDFNAQRVALVRDDNYWGKSVFGTPAPAYIIHPIFKDNDAANLAFQSADTDFSQTFLPQIWQLWEDKKLPVGTWLRQAPYHLPGQIPMIFLNVHRKGLDNPKVRQAIAFSINYAQIAETAMSRYSIPVNSSLILPDGGEKKFFDASSVASNGWKYDAAKATSILDSIGRKGSDGIYVLSDGTRLGPWKAQCPYGWTDWMTSLQGVAQSAKAVGIDIQTNFPEQPQDISQLQNGDFDIAMYSATGADPSSPWARFHDILDSRGVPANGQTAFWNYNRFADPSVASLLDRTAAASASDQPALFSQLDQVFMKNIPTIPLEYRPLEFFEYHEKFWTGFPNSGNPKAPPTTAGAGIKWLYIIRQKG